MAPSAVDPPALPQRVEKIYPPAKIFDVKETKFEKHIEPQADGREKALAQPEGTAAIVIDNGKLPPPITRKISIYFISELTMCSLPPRFFRRQGWLVFRIKPSNYRPPDHGQIQG